MRFHKGPGPTMIDDLYIHMTAMLVYFNLVALNPPVEKTDRRWY